MKILIVEDETHLADSLQALLESKGYEATAVYDGEDGAYYAGLGIYDLLILDVTLPKVNGWELARSLRKKHNCTPILMLSAKSELDDRVEGLNAGADYYLTKPFEARELIACIQALLRRQGNQVDDLVFGNTCLNLETGKLSCHESSIRLSSKEFDIMRALMQSGENNLSKDLLLTRVWGFDSEATPNHVEVFVGFLRKKLKKIGSDVRIEAIRNLGYHLEAGQDAA